MAEHSKSNWATDFVLLGTGLLAALATAGLSPVLPKIESAFAGTPDAAFLTKAIVTIVGIAMIVVSPLTGTIAARFGRRRVLIWSYAIFGVAGIGGGLLDSLPAIVISRFLVGGAGAAAVTLSITLIGDLYSGRARERRIGANQAVGSLLLSGLMPISGLLGDVTWRLAFAIHLIVLPLLVSAVISPQLRQADPVRAAPQDRGSWPLRPLIGIATMALFAGSITFSVTVFAPFHLRDLHIPGAGVAGEMISLTVFASVATSFGFGELRRWLSPMAVFAVAFAAWAIGFAALAGASALPQFALGMTVIGIGGGLVGPNVFSVAGVRGPEAARGRNIGIVKGIYYAGAFVGPSLLQLVSQRYMAVGAILTLALAAALLAAISLIGAIWNRTSSISATPVAAGLDRQPY
jgi:MFS family permease